MGLHEPGSLPGSTEVKIKWPLHAPRDDSGGHVLTHRQITALRQGGMAS